MTVAVDAELLAEFTNPPTPSGLLAEMLTSKFIDLWRYSDEGPPTDPPLDHGVYRDGWANVVEHTDDTWVVAHARGTTRGYSAVSTNCTRHAGQDQASGVYSHLPSDQAVARREADALAAGVAGEALDADIFVTERPHLHNDRVGSTYSVTCCTVSEAVGLIGLYLRAQGDYRITRDYGFDRGMFYWVAARELLPEAGDGSAHTSTVPMRTVMTQRCFSAAPLSGGWTEP